MRRSLWPAAPSRALTILSLGTVGGVLIFAGSSLSTAGSEPGDQSRVAAVAVTSDTATAADDTAARATNTPRPSKSPASTGTPENDPQHNEGAVEQSELAESPQAAPSLSRFAMPLSSWGVTDRYGAQRGWGLYHGGIDLAVDFHMSVYASCSGAVSETGTSGVYGNYIIIDCGEGWATLYAHLSSVAVANGQSVAQGGTIGVTGTTGFSTGEHLHFEIHYYGGRVNPEHYLDFKIAPGTPLSSGPIWFGSSSSGGSGSGSGSETMAHEDPTEEPTETPVPPTATETPTETPTPTSTPTPTNTPTVTNTPTPLPPTPTRTPTPRPIIY
jgi:hypothetical protein